MPKLIWPLKGRNAVKYYWGIPGEQVFAERAFSGGSEAQTYQSWLHAARHASTVPPCVSHRAPSHPPSAILHVHHPSTQKVSLTHTISCTSVSLLSFHFPIFFSMLLFLTFFSPHYNFPIALMHNTTFCWKVTAVKYWEKCWKCLRGVLSLHHLH